MYCVAIVKNELKREVFVADMAQQTPSTLSMRSNEREAAFLTTATRLWRVALQAQLALSYGSH